MLQKMVHDAGEWFSFSFVLKSKIISNKGKIFRLKLHAN